MIGQSLQLGLLLGAPAGQDEAASLPRCLPRGALPPWRPSVSCSSPLTSTPPRGSHTSVGSRRCVSSLTWMQLGAPVDSMRLAAAWRRWHGSKRCAYVRACVRDRDGMSVCVIG